MANVSSFSDASKAFFRLFDPPAQEIDSACCICLENCDVGSGRMVCPPDGSSKAHLTHENCQKSWALAKKIGGMPDNEIHCPYNRVCKTKLAHLLPKKSFVGSARDFFCKRAPVQIFTMGAALLGISQAVKPIVGALAPAANMISTAVSALCVTQIARGRVGTKTAHLGAIALMAIAGGSLAGLGSTIPGNWVCLSTFLKAAGIVVNFVGGEEAVVGAVMVGSKDYISIAAATAAVAFSSTWLYGGSLFMSGVLSAASLLGSYHDVVLLHAIR